MKNINLILLILLVSLSACRKNVDEVSTETLPLPTPPILENYNPSFSLAEGDLTGFVFDQNNAPIEDAEVTLNNLTTTTDQFGHFFFKDVDMNADGTIVQIKKEGYFDGSRRFNAVENTENRVQIEMITKTFDQSFESANGGQIALFGEGFIEFSPNSIQDANGELYTGMVKAASYWMDPTSYSSLTQMPGNLFGVNNQGEEEILATMGMVAVALESDSGEPLNILEGETAILRTLVPQGLITTAPAEVPLWSYNEEFGVWVEEGTSTLEGSYYVAEVTHFSFWNHDFSGPLVDFSGIITDELGNPLENYQVVISNQNNWLYGSGHTSASGVIEGLIPANSTLDLEILGICNDVLYSVEIGPFSTAADLGTIAIPASSISSTTVTGVLVDCDGDNLLNGVAIIDFGIGLAYEYVTDGNFSSTFSSCTSGSTMELVGYDLDAVVQSLVIPVTENAVNDLGNIEVCDDPIEDYLRLVVEGEEVIYLGMIAEDSISETTIRQSVPNVSNIGFYFQGHTPGDYSGNAAHGNFTDYTRNWNINTTTGFDVFEVTEYGVTGEQIKGTFSGTLTNYAVQPAEELEVSGEYSVTRNF